MGALREPGTPDVRALFRLAYAPIRKENTKAADRDSDGVLDKVDACPDDAGPASADPASGWLTRARCIEGLDIVEGLANFPEALLKLFSGANFGKLVLQLGA